MISVSSFSTRLLDLFMNLQSGMRIDYWSVAHNSTKGGMFILQFFVNSKRDNSNVHRAAANINASKSRAARGSACNVLLSRVTVDALTHRVLGPTHKRYRQETMQSNLDLTTAISRRNHLFLRLQDLVRN